jgi:hypothetical protein
MADLNPAPRYKVADTDEPAETGYEEWKRAKILRALEETRDRSNMISAEDVWKKLGFED